ncbi:MAG: DNA internalization-related competence protein ComEC/Rec2 [Candidatus Spyradocola sp.]
MWLALFAMLFCAAYSFAALDALPTEPLTGDLAATIARVDGERLILTDVTLTTEEGTLQPGAVLLEAEPCGHALTAGMTVRARVTLQPLSPPSNPHGWDERYWFLSDGVRYRCDAALDAHSAAAPFSLRAARAALQSGAQAHIDALWPEESGLAAALLLGEEDGLTDQEQQAFRRSGAAHLLAVSGLHVGFVAALAALLLGWMRKNSLPRILLTMALLTGYALLAESAFSVLRALMMLGLGLVARRLGRKPDAPTALAVVVLAALALRPTEVLRAGFLMSVSAVTGILLLGGRIDALLGRIRVPAVLRGSVAVSLGAQIGVLPVQLYLFHTVSLLSLLTNLLAVPLAAGAVMIGLPALLLHMLSPALAALPAFAARLMLRLLALLCETVAEVPFAQIDAASPPVFVLVCFFGLLFLLSPYLMEFAKRRRVALIAGMVCATVLSLGLWLPGELDRRGTPTVTFFSVGTADSALLRSGDDALLIDTGWSGSQAARCLQGEGLSLNAVLLTHADGDHAGGLEHLLNTVPVGAVMIPKGMNPDALAAAQARNIPILELTAGDRFSCGAFAVTVQSPDAVREGQENDDSLVLRVDVNDRTLLFTGDITERTEETLAFPDCDVLKVAHHGSATATSAAFLAQTAPELAVISVGTPNRYGFPRADTLERLSASGARILRTDQCGAVIVRIAPDGIAAQGYVPPTPLQQVFTGQP